MQDNRNTPVLHHSKTSVCSQKVRLVLAELDISWRSKVLDLKRGDQFTDAHLRLNPNASVPVYQDRTVVLTESNAIIIYLAQHYPLQKLYPADIANKQSVDYWLSLSVHFHSSVHVLTTLALNRGKLSALSTEELDEKLSRIPDRQRAERIYDIVKLGHDGTAVKQAIEFIKNIYAEMNKSLSGKGYLCSDDVTLADFAIFPFVQRLDCLNLTPDWNGENFSHLIAWQKTLRQRSSFNSAILDYHSSDALSNFDDMGSKVREALK